MDNSMEGLEGAATARGDTVRAVAAQARRRYIGEAVKRAQSEGESTGGTCGFLTSKRSVGTRSRRWRSGGKTIQWRQWISWLRRRCCAFRRGRCCSRVRWGRRRGTAYIYEGRSDVEHTATGESAGSIELSCGTVRLGHELEDRPHAWARAAAAQRRREWVGWACWSLMGRADLLGHMSGKKRRGGGLLRKRQRGGPRGEWGRAGLWAESQGE